MDGIQHLSATRRPGDEVHVASSGHCPTSPDRHGTIIRIFASSHETHYLVRWHDGRETVVPASALLSIEFEQGRE